MQCVQYMQFLSPAKKTIPLQTAYLIRIPFKCVGFHRKDVEDAEVSRRKHIFFHASLLED